jgi:hypothetical protein
VPPVYAPEVVAKVILHAAQHPIRELIAGGSGAKLSAARFAPRVADLWMERRTFQSQLTAQPVDGRPDNLHAPVADDGGERGTWSGHTRKSSLYTEAFLYPRAAATVVGIGVAAGLAIARLALRAHEPVRADDEPVQRVRVHPG